MKRRKLLILLVAVLSFAILLTSCDLLANKESEETSGAPAATEAPKTGVEEAAVDHEIRQYFDLNSEVEARTWAEVSRIDGEIVEYDDENNLIAVKTLDLDKDNYVYEKVEVYDLNTGEIILVKACSNMYGTTAENLSVMTVDISYPIIRVEYEHKSEDSDSYFDVYYYLVADASEYFYNTGSNEYELNEYQNGLISCKAGEKVFWIDRNGEIIRTVDAIIANGYKVDSFDAEYQGYLYSWTNGETIQVFNRSGMCCAEFKEKGLTNYVGVLDNGNLLIQTVNGAEDAYEPYNLDFGSYRAILKSYVMSITDGIITEVDLDFLVHDLESAYDGDGFGFELARGRHNQAIIRRIANRSFAVTYEYVVLNNDLTIEYSLKNDTIGVDLSTVEVLNSNFYTADVYSGGTYNVYTFDLDGNVVAIGRGFDVNTKYIVSDNAIYDYKMNLVYDYAANGFRLDTVDECSDNVFLKKYNFATGCNEVYLFNAKAAAPVLLADEIDVDFAGADYGVYALDTGDVMTIYNADGTALLVVLDNINDIEFNGFAIIESEFEGKPINYILK